MIQSQLLDVLAELAEDTWLPEQVAAAYSGSVAHERVALWLREVADALDRVSGPDRG